MKFLFSYILLLGIPFLSFGQENNAEDLLLSARNGALLFRLQTQSNKIEALEKAGNTLEAEKLRKNIALDQQAWINGFKEEYTFGKVYFFYDVDAREISQGSLEKVFDFEHNGIDEKPDNFLVAGLDITDNFSLKGIKLLTKEMQAVPKPLPKFISAYGFLHLSKKAPSQMIAELNKKLFARLN